MVDAFIDESWLVGPGGRYFLAVVSVMTTDRRKIELTVRLKRIPKLKTRSELKASASSAKVVKRLLGELASDPDVSIMAVIWRGKKTDVADNERLYQELVAHCALQTVQQSQRIDLHIDKRYTHEGRQRQLEERIREAIAAVPGNIVRILQEDLSAVKELAAPDFVAWALMQRYCHGNDEYYSIIRSKVRHFDDLSK